MRTIAIVRCIMGAAIAGALAGGCAQYQPQRQVELPRPTRRIAPALGFETPAEDSLEPKSLDELVEIAVKYHPDLRSAYARADAARGRMVQVGLYPNPMIGPNFFRLGDRESVGADPGIRMIATIVPNNKLALAKAAGAREVEAADWQAMTRWYTIVTQVRFAYFEYLTALYERGTLTNIVSVSAKAYDATMTRFKEGEVALPDVLRAKVEAEQNRLKLEVSNRRVEAAWRYLYTSLGRPPIRLDALVLNRQELERMPPAYSWNEMVECLRDNSTELQEARALIAQQEKLLAKARADVVPNLTLTAIPFRESATQKVITELFVTAPIPIIDRNQGNIHAARSEVARAFNDERTLELRLTERLTLAFQKYQSARQQVDAYRNVIVKEARTSLALIEKGYRSGDKKYDYTAMLQAQQVLFQAELSQAAAMGEQWRAVTEIAGILQQSDLMSGCAVGAAPMNDDKPGAAPK
jgi:outer membrane protein, heavy metal efflux system